VGEGLEVDFLRMVKCLILSDLRSPIPWVELGGQGESKGGHVD